MKQKVIRIALGVLVLLIWGAVIGRAVKKPDELDSATAAPVPVDVQITTKATEEPLKFTLARDPFLAGTSPSHRTEQRTTSHASNNRSHKNKPPTPINVTVVVAEPWPKVTYHGLVTNTADQGSRVGFLSVNGKQCLMRQGSTAEGLTVLRMRSDSVWVERSGEKKVLGRE